MSRGTNVLLAAILAAGVLISCEGDDAAVEVRGAKTPARTARVEAERLHDVEARLTTLRDRMEEAMRQASEKADRHKGVRRRLAREVEDTQALLEGVEGSRIRAEARMKMLERLAARLTTLIREIKSRR